MSGPRFSHYIPVVASSAVMSWLSQKTNSLQGSSQIALSALASRSLKDYQLKHKHETQNELQT